MSDNPNKKIRLDFQNRNDGSDVNEDLWGQDDFTAEEIDMLEIQATQSCNQTVTFPNHDTNINNSNFDKPSNITKVDDLKQQQYELEGRVKILSLSLEKTVKELNEERLNREKLINDKMAKSYERETNLQKEFEKLKSVLEFKEQEMKSVYSKFQILKSQMPEKKNAETFKKKDFGDFLTCSRHTNNEVEALSKFNSVQKFHRRNKLLVDSPRGKAESLDILSTILCNKLTIPSTSSSENLTNNSCVEDGNNVNFTPLSLVHLKNEINSDELLEYYKFILNRHLQFLKILVDKENVCNTSKTSPSSVQGREANYSSDTVISCLRDIICILSALKINSSHQKLANNENLMLYNEGELFTSEKQIQKEIVHNCRFGMKFSVERLCKILELLKALSNPATFPNAYSKTEEIELSLTALFNASLLWPEMFINSVSELPLHSFLNPHVTLTSVCISLKLIINLAGCEKFVVYLVHKDNLCLLCSLATFISNTVLQYPENYSISMVLVEDFLSLVFSVHNIAGIQQEISHCLSEVLKSIISSLWKYFQLKEQINLSGIIMKKGFLLLHFISASISNFKERRCLVEEEYISFLSNLLTFSKENMEFRELYDLIHNMWDFQTDVSEFDLDELSDETQTSINELDILNRGWRSAVGLPAFNFYIVICLIQKLEVMPNVAVLVQRRLQNPGVITVKNPKQKGVEEGQKVQPKNQRRLQLANLQAVVSGEGDGHQKKVCQKSQRVLIKEVLMQVKEMTKSLSLIKWFVRNQETSFFKPAVIHS